VGSTESAPRQAPANPAAGAGREGNYVERVIALTLLLILALGCFFVLQPFVPALLWAAILVISTWPIYLRLERAAGGRRTLCATIMTTGVALVLLLPMLVLGFHLSDSVGDATGMIRENLANGIPPLPDWIYRLPLVGSRVQEFWQNTTRDYASLSDAVQPYLGAARVWLIALGGELLQGIFQVVVSLFVAFFFYRDGQTVVGLLSQISGRLVGHRSGRLLEAVVSTINGVVQGVLGTAVIQAILMAVGFGLAGIPGVLFLGFLSFVFSLIPAGLTLLWLPAAIWLAHQGATVWAIFLVVWGLFVGTLDNWLRPILILKGSDLPLALILLGILGGALVFGFLGIFLGPVLLAVGYSLIREWDSAPSAAATPHKGPPTKLA
jgi:predicted PurR-regulated permease PerM